MEFASFSWVWLLLIFAGAVALLLLADRRGRTSMQSHSNELHRAARELTLRYNQLTSVREAAKESKEESKRRATELKSLRDTITKLTSQVTSLTEERNQARDTAADLQAKVTDLTTRLARADVRRANLEKELSAATLMRLEVLSQLRTDETQRIRALNRLRQPGGGVVATPVSPIATRRGDTRLSPLLVAKSPSESFLSNWQPDLDVDSSEDEVDMRALEDMRVKLERSMRRALAGRASDVFRVSSIELGKAAVSAKGIAVSNDVQAANKVVGICHSTNADDNEPKGPREASVVEHFVEGATQEHGETSPQQKQIEVEHSPAMAQVAEGIRVEDAQDEGVGVSSGGVSMVSVSAISKECGGAEKGDNEKKNQSAAETDVKATELEQQNGAADSQALREVTNETVVEILPLTTSDTKVGHEQQQAEQLNTNFEKCDEDAKLEMVNMMAAVNIKFSSTTPAGADLGNHERADEEAEELAHRTDAVTISAPRSCQDEKPDVFAAEVAGQITAEAAESSSEERHEVHSESVATSEHLKSVHENSISDVTKTMPNTKNAVDRASGEHLNVCDATIDADKGPHVEGVVDEDDDSSLQWPVTDSNVRPHSVAAIDKEGDNGSSAFRGADSGASPDDIEPVGEEEDDRSLAILATDTHAGPHANESIVEVDGSSSPISAADTQAWPDAVETVCEEGDGGSSVLLGPNSYARPHVVEEFGEEGDDIPSALPAADTQAKPQAIEDVYEERSIGSSQLTAADTYARPQDIKTVTEEEGIGSPPSSEEAKFGCVLVNEECKGGNILAAVREDSDGASGIDTGNKSEYSSRGVAMTVAGYTESVEKHGNEHVVILDAGAGPSAENVPTDGGQQNDLRSTEARDYDVAGAIDAGAGAEINDQGEPADSGADDHVYGYASKTVPEEEPVSTLPLGGGDGNDSVAPGDRKPDTAVVADDDSDCVLEKGAGEAVESVDTFVERVDNVMPTTIQPPTWITSAVEETIQDVMSTVALQTTTYSSTGLEEDVDGPNSEERTVHLGAGKDREIGTLDAGNADARHLDKDTESVKSANLTKLGDEALVASKPLVEQVSISRTPWLESLNPKLVRRSTSETILVVIRPVSPDVPGVISSAGMRKASE